MRSVLRWLTPALVLLVLQSSGRGQTREVADLLPARTLAVVVVQKPASLAREVTALLRGSIFENMPASLARIRARIGDEVPYWYFNAAARELGMFLSPEMIRDVSRVRGALFALTGISKEHGPEWVGVVLTGESNFPALFTRASLMFSNMRIVAEAEGVPIFREKQRRYEFKKLAPGEVQPEPPIKEVGPAMAMLPDCLVFGSRVEEVKDVLRRLKRRTSDPALSTLNAYQEALRRCKGPGLAAYVDTAGLLGQLDQLKGKEAERWSQIKKLLHPEAFRNLSAALTLNEGALDLQVHVKVDPRAKSPLVELLPDHKASRALLHFTPGDALGSVVFGLGGEAGRLDTALRLADVFALLQTGRALPRDEVEGVQKKLGLRFGKDVLGRIEDLGVSVSLAEGWIPFQAELLIRARDAEAAKYLEETALPKLAGLMNGLEAPEQERQTVGGQRLRILKPKELPPGITINSGRHQDILVLGLDAKRVAAALTAGSKKEGMLGAENVAEALKEVEGSVLGVILSGKTIIALSERVIGLPQKKTKDAPPRTNSVIAELTKAVAPLPPLVFSLQREKDGVTFQARQAGLRRAFPRATTVLIESSFERGMRLQIERSKPGLKEPAKEAIKEAEEKPKEESKKPEK